MQRQTPLIYLYGLVPGRYLPVWPVYIVGDDPQALAFKVAVDDARLLHLGPRIEETLEAAHILPDGHPRGEPVVPNGLALCKLHHAAFDGHLLGINPDLVVHVAPAILDEPDGPMLRHGLQAFNGSRIRVPRSSTLRPNREFLAERYEWFKKAV